ncbi:hypothetical protein [Pedobacter sp. SYSU D00535]|uniref:hypothetical protein n=1 Tax=Pedobacter sp. SYSU D00535 TaxID=2810308 RepID=UPI001A968E96|nr:hypothetical protein [Pedobacter sp. SYSU D00535]
MAIKTETSVGKKVNHSILAFSHQATQAYRYFTKEDFLFMMSDMSLEDILLDLARFKDLEEYEICEKIKFVAQEKEKMESLDLISLKEILF